MESVREKEGGAGWWKELIEQGEYARRCRRAPRIRDAKLLRTKITIESEGKEQRTAAKNWASQRRSRTNSTGKSMRERVRHDGHSAAYK